MTAISKDLIHQKREHFGSKAIKWLNPIKWVKVIVQARIGGIMSDLLPCPGCGEKGAIEHPETQGITCTNDNCDVWFYGGEVRRGE